jgi:WD40 repeat protein
MGNILKCMSSSREIDSSVQRIDAHHPPSHDLKVFTPLHGDSIVNSVLIAGHPWLTASGAEDGMVVLFDWSCGSTLRRWMGHKRAVNRLAYGTRSGNVFSGSRDGSVLMWSPDADAAMQRFVGHELTVNGVAACAPDDALLFSGSRDWTVR